MAQHGYLQEFDKGWDRGGGQYWSDEDRERGRHEAYERGRDRGRSFIFGGRTDWERAPRKFSSAEDENYLAWREKQIEQLDRDYAEYCREREQAFHQDFDSWRRRHHGNPPPLQTGVTQSGPFQEPAETLELTNKVPTTDPVGAATLGTTSDRIGRA